MNKTKIEHLILACSCRITKHDPDEVYYTGSTSNRYAADLLFDCAKILGCSCILDEFTTLGSPDFKVSMYPINPK